MAEEEYIISTDVMGNPLEGGHNYILHLPPDIPASDFWSVIVYDSQTRLMIRTDQSWPSVHSNCKRLVVNHDSSVDAWFGPIVKPGKENNWVKTIPGKGWFMILRLYDPLESGFNKSWRPGDIEEIVYPE
jgi:hypothetical protein